MNDKELYKRTAADLYKKCDELQTKVNTYCVPQWISVKDRMPEPKKDVLVYSEIEHPHKIRVDFLKVSGQWFNSFHVTHWMPLPEPPKEQTEREKELEMWSLMS